jgi:hypothetical protein
MNNALKTHNRNIHHAFIDGDDLRDFRRTPRFKALRESVLSFVQSKGSATYREIKAALTGADWSDCYFNLVLSELEADRLIYLNKHNPLITRVEAQSK